MQLYSSAVYYVYFSFVKYGFRKDNKRMKIMLTYKQHRIEQI